MGKPLDVETRQTLERVCRGLGIVTKYSSYHWREEEGYFISRVALGRALTICQLMPEGQAKRDLFRACMKLKMAMGAKEN